MENNLLLNKAVMKIKTVWFDEHNIYIVLYSGQTIGNPLNWFTRLYNATPEQRNRFEMGPSAESLHLEELDEDLSLEGFFDFNRKLSYAKI